MEVTYLRAGRAYTARGRGAVLACYNMMIPYLCPDLPAAQKQALHALIKTPLGLYQRRAANWLAFDRLKVHRVYAPGGYHTYLHLNPHVDVGAYRSVQSPNHPILVHMVRTPARLDFRSTIRIAPAAPSCWDLLRDFRAQYPRQLGRTLNDGGFDPARDITAITVNRWPHGYAPEYNPLFDPELPEVAATARRRPRPFGRISIANSDSGGAAYTDSAIDQGHRAVMELLSSAERAPAPQALAPRWERAELGGVMRL